MGIAEMAPRAAAPEMTPQTRRSTVRLGVVTTHYPQLSQTFVANEIAELRAIGFEVETFSLNAPADSDVRTEEGAREQRTTFYIKQAGAGAVQRAALRVFVRHPAAAARFVRASLRGVGLDPRAVVWRCFHIGEAILVRDHCRRAGIGHLHAQFGQATATVAWLAHELDAAVADGSLTWSFTIHGFHEFVNEQRSQLDRKAESAAFVACVSDFTRAQLMRITTPDLWGRLHVVRVGIDFERFTYAPRPNLRAPAVVLMVGRLSTEKGHNVLIDALAQLRRAGADVLVELVGDGDHRSGIEEHARRVGVADFVRILGELPPETVAQRLREADVFCLPSFAEGLPVSIMEAMAVGTPVVTTYVSGIPELAIDRETAMVVPAGNADALAYALASLLADEALRTRLTTNAARRVRQHHDLHESVAQLAALLVGGDRPAAPAPSLVNVSS